MNNIFQVTWNSARQTWVVASELAQSDSPPRSVSKAIAGAMLLSLIANTAQAQPLAGELPQGAAVLMGNSTSQVNGKQMVINQTSDRALTQWNSFNIGADASVRINQPTAGSSSVNRVLSTDPSSIYGTLSSNGQVVLVNPAGVVFGSSARIDGSSIVASSLKMSDEDFAQGKLNFAGSDAATGSVINQGHIQAAPGGYVALIGPQIENTGTLEASGGSVLLGAGDRVSLSRAQDGLIQMSVDAGTLDAQIKVGGVIRTPDGRALVTARAAGEISRSVINMDGVIEARGMVMQGGRIVLDSGENGTSNVSGILNASSDVGQGGAVHVLGDQVGLFGQAQVNASGATHGGEVLIGGDYQGNSAVQNATATVLDSGASILANAGTQGNGGKVILWSDEYTGMYGNIEARGGQQGGQGGFVETSSKDNLQAFGSVDTSAPHGTAGQWLLDPRNVTIVNPGTDSIASTGGTFTPVSDSATISATSINAALNNGNNVTITTGASGVQAGDITVSSAIGKTSGTAATLTLQADNSIHVNSDIQSTSGALNITLSAANKVGATTGGVKVNANLSSNGGKILIGGAYGTANQGIGYALNADSSSAAVTIGTSKSIQSGGGKIVINGYSTLPGGGSYSGVKGGVYVLSGATVDSGGGNIYISGIAASHAKVFGFAAEANSGTTTTFKSGTSGSISMDAQNLLDVNGAIGLTNSGGQARIQFIAPSVAHMLFKLNGSPQLTTFTIKPPCDSSYPNCGTLVVPGSNGSYLYAGYQAVSMPTESIYVFTSGASKVYNQSNSADGVVVTTTGAPVDFSTAGLAFTTASKNVGVYTELTSAPLNPNTFNSTNTKSYAVAYYNSNYEITPKAVTASAGSKAYDGTTSAHLTLNGIFANDVASATSSSISFASKDVGTNILVSGTGMSLVGADAQNYSLSGSTITALANITQRVINLTGERVYDGSVDINSGILELTNLADNEELTLLGVGQMSNKTAGTGKTFAINTLSLGNGSNGAASNYTLVGGTRTANISKADLVVSGLTASDKTYDATTTATLAGIAGVTALGSDVVSLAGTATGTFATKDVGTAKAVTVAGLTLSGTDSGNYNIVAPASLTANISKADLAVSGLTANNKTYNATTAATLAGSATVSALGSDVVTVAGTAAGTFGTKDVGTAKAVSVAGLSLIGVDAGNYTIVAPTGLTANISKANLQVTGLTANDKVYDTTTAATLAGTAAVSALGSDVVSVAGTAAATFGTKDVGTGKAVSVTGLTLSGTDSGNYNIVAPASLTANISKADLQVNGLTANDKVYDTTTAATLAGTAGVTALGSDVVSVAGTATGTFGTKDVGTAKALTVAGLTLSGTDSGNYNIIAPSNLTANISKADLAVSGLTANNKTYDATTSATLAGTAAVSALGSDVVSVAGTAAATFGTKDVGTGKAVSVTGLTLSGTDSGNYNIVAPASLTANISKADLAVSGLTASNKTYDATTTATLAGTAGVTALGSDVVSVSGTATGSFGTKDVGTAKAITVSGLTLSGTDAGNYNIVAPASLTANISKADLAVSGLTASNKTYDATTTATLAGTATVSVLGSDMASVSGTATGTFGTKDVGTAKAVTVAGLTLSGTDADNYNIVAPAGLTANISKADLAVSGLTASDKTYDATTTATLAGTATVSVLGSDVVSVSGTATGTFGTKDVGTAKAVSVAGLTLSGTDADNYNIVAPAGLTANISKADLAVSGLTASDKTYDATTTATLAGTAAVTALGSDVVSVAGTATGSFGTKNVGTAKAVTVAGLTLSGTDSGNYNIIAPSNLTANISKADLAVSGLTASDKTYDANTSATLAGTATVSALGSDVVSVAGTAAATFGTTDVGTAKAVTVAGLTLSGTDAGNYNIVAPASLTANISKADLAVSGLTASDKTYDATTTATLAGTAAVTALGSDVVSVAGTATGSFGTKDVGTAKAITVSGLTLSGTDSGNYNIVAPASLTANISKADLAVSGLTASDKTYDANTSATLAGTAAVTALGSDVVSVAGTAAATFGTKDVGTGKAVSVTGLTLSGTDSGNYNIVAPASLTANISKADLAVSGLTASNKTYDATTTATLAGTAGVTALGSDVVTVAGTAAAEFDNKNAGNGKAVTVAGLTLSGTDAGNYNLVAPTDLTANISKADLLIGGLQGRNKTYDGSTVADVTGVMYASGLLSTDEVGIQGQIQHGQFANAAAGNGKSVTTDLGQLTLSGPDADNYQIAGLLSPLTADIQAAPVAVPTAPPVPSPNTLIVESPKMPDAVVATQTSGSQVSLSSSTSVFKVSTAFIPPAVQPAVEQSLVLNTANQSNSIAVSQSGSGALVIGMNGKLTQLDPEKMQALPVFVVDNSTLKLDFKLKVESQGQELNIQQVATGSVNSQPDMSKPGLGQMVFKIQGTQQEAAEFQISTIDGALIILPTNPTGVKLLESNPKLVIGAAILEGRNDSPGIFEQIDSVVLPARVSKAESALTTELIQQIKL